MRLTLVCQMFCQPCFADCNRMNSASTKFTRNKSNPTVQLENKVVDRTEKAASKALSSNVRAAVQCECPLHSCAHDYVSLFELAVGLLRFFQVHGDSWGTFYVALQHTPSPIRLQRYQVHEASRQPVGPVFGVATDCFTSSHVVFSAVLNGPSMPSKNAG